ncbi:MAG: secondary thiamine-phosphate synthase enzyme YjbQ [Bradymonadaceae bacterium]
MEHYRERVEVELDANFDAANLEPHVDRIVAASGVSEGTVTVFSAGATAAVTTIEFESGCLSDLERALEQIAPSHEDYAHNEKWGDGNGFSHLRSALLDPSVSAPVVDGEAGFSTWQQPVVLNFDNRARRREVHVVVQGRRTKEEG